MVSFHNSTMPREASCASLLAMRRARAILVIIALLATPLALFAHGYACENACCGSIHCLSHGRNHACCPMCEKAAQHKIIELGFVAPIAPTFAIAHAELMAPASDRENISNFQQHFALADLSVLLQPPRTSLSIAS
jgi:hypothetical protein